MCRNYNVAFAMPLEAAKYGGLPFIKRKSFAYQADVALGLPKTAATGTVMDYVRNETGYDENLIWENLLRTHSADEIAAYLNDDLEHQAVLLPKLLLFCRGAEKIYLYGTGGTAAAWTSIMKQLKIDFDGYIVSDGQFNKGKYLEKSVYRLSEIDDKTCGIILSIMRQTAKDVLPMLKAQGFGHVFTLG